MKTITDLFIAALVIFGVIYFAGIHPALGLVSCAIVFFRLGLEVRKRTDEKEENGQ